jgi:hypothetical protein
MPKAQVIYEQKLDISDRYRVELEVLAVEPSAKYRDGIKVSFILIDGMEKVPRLLVDNHAPHGFHVHTELPGNKEARSELKVETYKEALEEFWRLAKEILNEN